MDKNTQVAVEKEKIGGIELKPAYIGDIFYHDIVGKVCFKYHASGELNLIEVDTNKEIPYSTVEEVLKSSTWMEKDIGENDLRDMLASIRNASVLCKVNGDEKSYDLLVNVELQFERLVKSNKSWRNEYLTALEYANNTELYLSSQFKDVSYYKSSEERLNSVLVNIKKLAMRLADTHKKVSADVGNLQKIADVHLDAADDYINTITELKQELLSQKIVFNSILAPHGFTLERASEIVARAHSKDIKLEFLDELEVRMKQGDTLDQIRGELIVK